MPDQRQPLTFRPRFLLICAAAMVAIFIPIFRSQDGEAQSQQAKLWTLQNEQYAEVTRGEAIKDQLQKAETNAFREREARRRYGYAMPGSIRFVLEDLQLPLPLEELRPVFEVLPESAPAAEEAEEKDWSNFN
jgi:cell division protein FtsB